MSLLRRDSFMLIGATTISLFHVLFLWNFWQYGINVVGINITVFWFLILGFYCVISWNKISKSALQWLIPISLIILSLSFYTTFTTAISLFLLPVIFFIFTSYTSHDAFERVMWSRYFPVIISVAIFYYLSSIFIGQKKERNKINIGNKSNSQNKISASMIKQVIVGVVVLAILSLGVIIPLLSSVDEVFGRFFADILEWILNIPLLFSPTMLYKTLLFLIGLVVLIGLERYWLRKINFSVRVTEEKSLENQSITLSIILVGVMALYILFIAIQIKTLLISSLPIDFAQTEKIVKSGFWQLFLLTILNILFYIGTYKKSSRNVNRILFVFTISSLFLVFSAGYRVFMYVTVYGLSYEKFFAAYTVVYCLVVFGFFLTLFFLGKGREIVVKGVVLLALWMYAFLAISPVESIIFKTNLKLTKGEGSRININELTMLNFDALYEVEKNYDNLIVEARKDFLKKNDRDFKVLELANGDREEWIYEKVDKRWINWIERTQNRGVLQSKYNYRNRSKEVTRKSWYEKTIKELMYEPKIEVEKLAKPEETSQIKKWNDPIHGFSVEYLDSLRFDAGDSYTKTDLIENDYWLTVSTNVVGHAGRSVYFTVYNADDPSPSKDYDHYTKILKQVKRNGNLSIRLPNVPDTPAYIVYAKNYQTGKVRHALVFDLGDGNVGVISSNDAVVSVDNFRNISSDDYIDLITPHKELADVIKSFRLIKKTI